MVCLDHPASRDHQVVMGHAEQLGMQEDRVHMEPPAGRAPQDLQDLKGLQGLLDSVDLRDQLVTRDHAVRLVPLELQAQMAAPATPVPTARPVTQDPSVYKDSQDLQATLKDLPGIQDHPVPLGRPVSRGHRDLDSKVLQVPKVLRVQQVHQAATPVVAAQMNA